MNDIEANSLVGTSPNASAVAVLIPDDVVLAYEGDEVSNGSEIGSASTPALSVSAAAEKAVLASLNNASEFTSLDLMDSLDILPS